MRTNSRRTSATAGVEPRPTYLASPRTTVLVGTAAMIGASVCFLGGAAIAVPSLPTVGALGVGALRFQLAAVLLLVVLRPTLRGRQPRDWARLGATGLAMAVMTLCSYAALARMPLGTAVTIEYLGPFTVAIAYRRGRADLVSAGLALGGVAMIGGSCLTVTPAGAAYGVATAVALGGYVALQAGRPAGRVLDNLTLTLTVAAFLTLPVAVMLGPQVTVTDAARLIGSGVVGTVLAYALDTFALRRVGGRRASVLLSLDPALGTLCGFVLLGQALPLMAMLGVLTVVAAGLLATRVRLPAGEASSGEQGHRAQ